jgi:hypothetical protein
MGSDNAVPAEQDLPGRTPIETKGGHWLSRSFVTRGRRDFRHYRGDFLRLVNSDFSRHPSEPLFLVVTQLE